MSTRLHVEFMPTNGHVPHLAVIENDEGVRLMMAYASREQAAQKVSDWLANGSIGFSFGLPVEMAPAVGYT